MGINTLPTGFSAESKLNHKIQYKRSKMCPGVLLFRGSEIARHCCWHCSCPCYFNTALHTNLVIWTLPENCWKNGKLKEEKKKKKNTYCAKKVRCKGIQERVCESWQILKSFFFFSPNPQLLLPWKPREGEGGKINIQRLIWNRDVGKSHHCSMQDWGFPFLCSHKTKMTYMTSGYTELFITSEARQSV